MSMKARTFLHVESIRYHREEKMKTVINQHTDTSGQGS